MKKTVLFLIGIAFITLSSCGEATVESPEFQISKDVSYDFDFSVPRTAGNAETKSTTVSINIKDALETSDSFDSLEISRFELKIKDFQGVATTGTISLKLMVNGSEIASIVDKKPSDEGVFTVTDAAKINILRDAFVNSETINLVAEATVQSDDGQMDFKVEVSFRVSAIV